MYVNIIHRLLCQQKMHCSFNILTIHRVPAYRHVYYKQTNKLQLILFVMPMVWLVVCAVFFLVILVSYCTETGAVYISGPHTRPGPHSLLYYVFIHCDVYLKAGHDQRTYRCYRCVTTWSALPRGSIIPIISTSKNECWLLTQ